MISLSVMFNNYFWELLLALTEKEIKARYKNAVLGFLWIFINPLIQMLVMGFVFSFIFRFGVKDYFLFLFYGLLSWNFFSQALTKAIPRIVFDRSLIQKSDIPRETIPLSMVFSHFFYFIISWILLLGYLIITLHWELLTPEVLLEQFLGIIMLLIFSCGLSVLLSCLNVFFRDINFINQAITIVWFYATPIIYPLNQVPLRYLWIYYLNPLSGPFFLIQKPFLNMVFPLPVLIAQILFIMLTLIFSLRIFKKYSRNFSDWL